MAKFCGKCGSKLDEVTGLCLNCDIKKIKQQAEQLAEPSKEVEKKPERSQQQNVPLSKKEAREKRKADKRVAKKERKIKKKADRKAKKKGKWATKTFGQKVRSVLIKLLVWILVLIVLVATVAVVLTYYKIVNIPIISSVISEIVPNQHQDDMGGTLYTLDENAIAVDEETGIVYVNNIIIIFFNKGSSEQEINSTITSINGKVVGSIPAIDQYQVRIANQTLDELSSICQNLKQKDCVFDAIYDTAFEIDTEAVPDDPWGKKWYGKKETWSENHPSGANWWVEAVDAPSAWEYDNLYQKIKIGIVDNGFDNRHEDLRNVITYTSPVNNKEEHGTHVAGIVGAEANNGKGITGLVWNCELYTYDWQLSTTQSIVNDIFDMQWSTSNQILGGTVLLIEKGAKVVNLSAGQTGSMTGSTRPDRDVDDNGHDASLYLHSLLSRNYDFVVVQSAGNGNENNTSVDAKYNGLFCSITEENCVTGNNVSYEDIVGRVIVVGAAQNKGSNQYSQTYWSNAGSRVDICAPGQDIYSTIPGGFFGSYKYLPGTSMAAPIVTGVASLVWSVNPELSGVQVKDIVCDNKNTENIVVDNNSENHPLTNTYNLVNANLAVEAAMKYSITSPETPTLSTENNRDSAYNRVTSDERDIVLVLDTSGSMAGTPVEEVKKASTKFVSTILKEDASIGIVTYASSANMSSDFSVNESQLQDTVNNISSGGGTNIESGLQKAEEMLESSNAKKQIIVLMSDGAPGSGKVGDELIAYADAIKDQGVYIYTLGFFGSIGDTKSSAQILMEELASDGCHYEVANAEDLVFFFGDIADQINGQKYIYVRIACPVDVTVTHDGETLCSVEDELCTRTNFGSITFEENAEETDESEDNRIKVLRLNEGTDYDIRIEGNGRGHMDYTIGFMDGNGEYSDLREFENIKITQRTIIETVAANSGSTILNVDEDGDGKFDLRYRATENGRGEVVDYTYFVYAIIILVLFLLVVIMIVKIKKTKNVRRSI